MSLLSEVRSPGYRAVGGLRYAANAVNFRGTGAATVLHLSAA
ncbi:hypothetical protein FM113_00845 [Leucobacter sp. 7(1)]|nr:hypothetical protein FM113_00845 [Leucobacter sp. 7(1)]